MKHSLLRLFSIMSMCAAYLFLTSLNGAAARKTYDFSRMNNWLHDGEGEFLKRDLKTDRLLRSKLLDSQTRLHVWRTLRELSDVESTDKLATQSARLIVRLGRKITGEKSSRKDWVEEVDLKIIEDGSIEVSDYNELVSAITAVNGFFYEDTNGIQREEFLKKIVDLRKLVFKLNSRYRTWSQAVYDLFNVSSGPSLEQSLDLVD